MTSLTRFEIRFMKSHEAGRVAELVRSLQEYQQKKNCTRLPEEEDFLRELIHLDSNGNLITNNNGTFTLVAIDLEKPHELGKLCIVGYLMYTQSFSIIHGRHLYINSFFIEQDYRRCGLGNKLIDFMRQHGQSLGHDGFDVPFMNNNLAGQSFYKKLGAYLVNEDYQLFAIEL